MNILAFDKNFSRDFESAYEQDFDDLIWGRRAGHMGHHEYVSASMSLWMNFIKEQGAEYYIPENEIKLITKAGKLSASLLGDKEVTLVSRGCGTKFLEKEGALIKHLRNVVGVVYIDRCDSALEQSLSEGKNLLPNAWHKTIKDDLYNPDLSYPVQGTEVGTCFGLTLMNIEGVPSKAALTNSYIKNLNALKNQMQTGAHFITTFDHNQDKVSVERAYAGQSEFAKDMLRRTNSIDPDRVEFVVNFFSVSQTLSHGFQFKENTTVSSRSGEKTFERGDVIWFNNSVKPSILRVKEWHRNAGFTAVRADVPLDHQRRLGWHHLISS